MKFHSSELKSKIKGHIKNFSDVLIIIFSVTMYFLVALIFLPVRLISFGIIKKLTNPILNIYQKISDYFFSKIIFMMYNK